MDQVLNSYITFIKDFKNLSTNTVSSYERDVRQYIEYLKTLGFSDIYNSGHKEINAYIRFLINSGKSYSTISRCVSSLRVFYRFLIRSGLVMGNPVVNITTPKIRRKSNKKLKRYYRLEAPFPQLTKKHKAKLLRDKVVLDLLNVTGLKVNELISLNVDDIYMNKKELLAKTEKKDHIIRVKQSSLEGLKDYLNLSRPFLIRSPEEKALIVNSSGKRMSRQGIWKITRRYICRPEKCSYYSPEYCE